MTTGIRNTLFGKMDSIWKMIRHDNAISHDGNNIGLTVEQCQARAIEGSMNAHRKNTKVG